MSPSSTHDDGDAGFTLLEVLVALSIVALLFSSIAALIVTSARGARSIGQHLSELETARAVVTALPDRDQLSPGRLSGSLAGFVWDVDVSPFDAATIPTPRGSTWIPQAVVVTIRSPAGVVTRINTVRLYRRTGE